MYRSIQELGEIFDRKEEAQKMVDEFTEFYDEYRDNNAGKEKPKVLVLMGLPAVSYTHLDVYKRQGLRLSRRWKTAR